VKSVITVSGYPPQVRKRVHKVNIKVKRAWIFGKEGVHGLGSRGSAVRSCGIEGAGCDDGDFAPEAKDTTDDMWSEL
jgi:hypothetical protein